MTPLTRFVSASSKKRKPITKHITYHDSFSCFENIYRGTAVKQVTSLEHLKLNKNVVGCRIIAKMYKIYKEYQWKSVAFATLTICLKLGHDSSF